MAQRLIYYKHNVTIVCGSYKGAETGLKKPYVDGKREGYVDGIRIIEFNLSYSNSDNFAKRVITFLKYTIRSIKLIFTEKYDLVFATSTPLTAGIPGIIARWFRGKLFVFEVRDLWPELPKEMGIIRNRFVLNILFLLEFILYKSANRCIGLSPGIVDGILKAGIKRDKVIMIPNGCDLSIFSAQIKSWYPDGINKNDLLAVFSGTHGVANGLESLLDAATELQKRDRADIKLVLIGQGKLKPDLQKKALDLDLDNIIFLEPVNKKLLAGLFKRADLGIQVLANIPAFYYGTSPNKFFDYISAGLPVINNYPGWISEMIRDNQCGFVVEADDPAAFADALELAADSLEDLKIMGDNAKKLAIKRFNRIPLADEWVEWVVKGRLLKEGN
tara:strand:- start:4794 stop:5957 length:1164 start_codon:yes stop_codon:yes gene_type:complete